MGEVIAEIEEGATADRPGRVARGPGDPQPADRRAGRPRPPPPPAGARRRPRAAAALGAGASNGNGNGCTGPAGNGDGQAVKASPALRRLMAEQDSPPATSRPAARPAASSAPTSSGRSRPGARRCPVSAPAAGAPLAPLAPYVAKPNERVVPMTPLRKTVARRLLEAQNTAAILTTFNEINMAEVMALRERYQEQFTKRHGIKLGFMSFFVKAAVDALKAFPIVNAEVRGNDIIYKDHYDIGVAVGGGKGLVVPVVRNADRLSLAEVERTIAELAVKAKENRIPLQELEGGTFTISNGGIYGSMMSTPILNPPQSGILGLHAIQKRPVAVGEAIALRPMMYVALSLRPPGRRRPRSGAVPGAHQGMHRGSRAHPDRGLIAPGDPGACGALAARRPPPGGVQGPGGAGTAG